MSLEDSAPRFCLIPLLFSILSLAAAQSGNWTQQMPATSPSPRNQHALAYDSAHSDVVLFGGSNGNPNLAGLGDTWTWNGTNWTQASPQTKPPARYSHAMAYDAMHQQTVLFGERRLRCSTIRGSGITPIGPRWRPPRVRRSDTDTH